MAGPSTTTPSSATMTPLTTSRPWTPAASTSPSPWHGRWAGGARSPASSRSAPPGPVHAWAGWPPHGKPRVRAAPRRWALSWAARGTSRRS
eukprot:5496248-Lingulodinium_polyedra.AAC.1